MLLARKAVGMLHQDFPDWDIGESMHNTHPTSSASYLPLTPVLSGNWRLVFPFDGAAA
jgi:hypothetical protein